MGASRVFLLGFDMSLGKDGKANYYKNIKNPKQNGKVYPRFMRGFVEYEQHRKGSQYKHVEIINANMESGLTIYPKKPREDVI